MQFLEEFASMCVDFGISLSPKKTKIGGPSTNTVFYGSEILSFDHCPSVEPWTPNHLTTRRAPMCH